jgi:serine phosphatase RsbU (regulator of sigma subunit)
MIGEKRKYSDNIEANENEFYNQNVLKQSIEIAKCSTNALLNGQVNIIPNISLACLSLKAHYLVPNILTYLFFNCILGTCISFL